ncbi:MAG: hypothetical protein II180_10845 [Proteobacteria bacterium]|nr:hypothetical protein [Pseudomonadota bacterium]
MKKSSHIVLLFSLLIFAVFPAIASAKPMILAHSEDLQIHGPVFSMSEPWTLKGFGEKFVAEKYADSVEKLNLEQGKTVKNSAGKAYLLQAEIGYDDMGFTILGVRTQVKDAQMVVFYFLHPESHDDYRSQIKTWGTSYRTYARHSLSNVYAGTFDGKPAKFIEFENTFTGEWNCAQPDVNEKKCMKTQYEAGIMRKLFVIASEGDDQSKVLASGTISEGEDASSDVNKSLEKARKKAKSVKALKKIDLSNATCEVNKVKKDYILECTSKK